MIRPWIAQQRVEQNVPLQGLMQQQLEAVAQQQQQKETPVLIEVATSPFRQALQQQVTLTGVDSTVKMSARVPVIESLG